jgi:hypothetical protein
MIKATCTWGDGPDVLLSLEDHRLMCYEHPHDYEHGVHGFINNGSTDLTADEAISLAMDLLKAAQGAKELDLAVEEQYQKETRNKKVRESLLEAAEILEINYRNYLEGKKDKI